MSKHTIKEWSEIKGVVILDPDGFDRKDPDLMERTFTEQEFNEGMVGSTVAVKRILTRQEELLKYVNDSKSIQKAVESSMEKRRKVLYPRSNGDDETSLEISQFIEKWFSADRRNDTLPITRMLGKTEMHFELKHLIEAHKQRWQLEAKRDQAHRDFLQYSLNTDVDESILMQIRDVQLGVIDEEAVLKAVK